jgi:hypothetical protein
VFLLQTLYNRSKNVLRSLCNHFAITLQSLRTTSVPMRDSNPRPETSKVTSKILVHISGGFARHLQRLVCDLQRSVSDLWRHNPTSGGHKCNLWVSDCYLLANISHLLEITIGPLRSWFRIPHSPKFWDIGSYSFEITLQPPQNRCVIAVYSLSNHCVITA